VVRQYEYGVVVGEAGTAVVSGCGGGASGYLRALVGGGGNGDEGTSRVRYQWW